MLSTTDFSTFVYDVHRLTPFPWQRALVERVLAEDRWPDVIDVPTGLGKTWLIDVALFVSAIRPALSRRRIFFVVDRRLVVDEAYEHACEIRQTLNDPPKGSVAEAVADALRQPDDGEGVLDVTRMRGGVTWDARWVARPDRYAVVTGTVDQVGSRLLFRGYGVSEHARSIDAALVGSDSLVVIDEAHLAQPLIDTVGSLARLDNDTGAGGRWRAGRFVPTVVQMSATTRPVGSATVHTITSADEVDPVAGRRLRAPKRLYLVELPKVSHPAAAAANAIARLALDLVSAGGVVGVVVNTVARARAVFQRIDGQVDAVLLTGRSRTVDREYLLSDYYDRLRAGRVVSGEPLVIVATQTIEVGANIDLDALVTESAPFDALTQRLGRLNRLGQITAPPAPALVVHDASVGAEDPVYGPTRLATWEWLSTRPGLSPTRYTQRLDPSGVSGGSDASPLALRELARQVPDGLRPNAAYVPVLTESTLDAWVRTSPTPHPDPPVAPFLHGLPEARPLVRVVWRAGLRDLNPDQQRAAVEGVPPASDEQVEVSLGAVRRWLAAGASDPAVSDLDGPDDERAEPSTPSSQVPYRQRDPSGRPIALRVRGRDDVTAVSPADLVPDDLIVVPAEYGGCDQYGWNPESAAPVVDVADLVSRRDRPLLRVGPYLRTVIGRYHPELAETAALPDLLALADRETDEEVRTSAEYRDALAALAKTVPKSKQHLPLARNLRILCDRARASVWEGGGLWRALLAARGAGLAEDRTAAGSSVLGRRVTLDAHQSEVAACARQFAENLGLPDDLATCVELAAGWHDEGKRDPRFQVMLWGGDRLQAEVATEPLAKSGTDAGDRAARRAAQRRAAYPWRMRHEALSARIVALRLGAESCADDELVVHLVASHHGHGRPLLPPVADPEPVKVQVVGQLLATEHTVDWDGPARFVRLNQRYGRWGLALLETIVRLADIWCSARDK